MQNIPEKSFDQWNLLKKDIYRRFLPNTPLEGEVWWAYLGLNIGHEQDGAGRKFLRPVLVVKKFSARVCWALPLSRQRPKFLTYLDVSVSVGTSCFATFANLRSIDTKRLESLMFVITKDIFNEIRNGLKELL